VFSNFYANTAPDLLYEAGLEERAETRDILQVHDLVEEFETFVSRDLEIERMKSCDSRASNSARNGMYSGFRMTGR
jgi:hypothetical protein